MVVRQDSARTHVPLTQGRRVPAARAHPELPPGRHRLGPPDPAASRTGPVLLLDPGDCRAGIPNCRMSRAIRASAHSIRSNTSASPATASSCAAEPPTPPIARPGCYCPPLSDIPGAWMSREVRLRGVGSGVTRLLAGCRVSGFSGSHAGFRRACLDQGRDHLDRSGRVVAADGGQWESCALHRVGCEREVAGADAGCRADRYWG
jgi:hypothetical protein